MTHRSAPGGCADGVAWAHLGSIGRCGLVVAGGEIDVATCAGLRHTAAMALDSSRWVVIDLHAVTFIDAAGLDILVDAQSLAHDQGGEVALVKPSNLVRRLLEITSLDHQFQRYPTREAACTALSDDPSQRI